MIGKKVNLFVIVTMLLLPCFKGHAQEVSEAVCESYINMYCLRCHPVQRICDKIGVMNETQWQGTIKLMGEYGNLDKDVQDRVSACVSSPAAKSFKMCGGKSAAAGKAMAMTVSTESISTQTPLQSREKIFRSIGPQEALRLLQSRDDVTFLDVRTPKERSRGAIPGSKLVSIPALVKGQVSFPKDKPIMLVCAVGGRSYVVGQLLSKNGYREVYNLSGGVKGWYKAGLPLAYD